MTQTYMMCQRIRHLLDDRILDDTPEHFHMHEALDDELAASGTKSKDSMPIMYEASNEELRASRMKWKESTPLLYEVSDDGSRLVEWTGYREHPHGRTLTSPGS